MKTITILVPALACLASIATAGNSEPFALTSAGAESANTDWSGFYAGLQFQHYSAEMRTEEVDPLGFYIPFSITYGLTDEVGEFDTGNIGLVAGYNWQNQAFVYGIEVSVAHGDVINRTDLPHALASAYTQYSGHTMGEVSARAGLSRGNLLFYGSAGLVALNGTFGIYYSDSFGAVDLLENRTAFGFSLGGGVEMMVDDDWSIGLDYTATQFNTIRDTLTISGGLIEYDWDYTISSETISLSVSRHF